VVCISQSVFMVTTVHFWRRFVVTKICLLLKLSHRNALQAVGWDRNELLGLTLDSMMMMMMRIQIEDFYSSQIILSAFPKIY
jgi:hypothetical protein